MKVETKNTVSPAGLFFSVFFYLTAGFLLFEIRSPLSFLACDLTATALFLIIATGTKNESNGTYDFFARVTGDGVASVICGLLTVVSLIAFFSDTHILAESVFPYYGEETRLIFYALVLTAAFAASRGLSVLSAGAQIGSLLLVALLFLSFFFPAEYDAGDVHAAAALRSLGGAGVFFALAAHTVCPGDPTASGALNARGYRPKNRRLYLFGLMTGAAFAASLFSYLIQSVPSFGSATFFFLIAKWCFGLLRSSLSLFTLANFCFYGQNRTSRVLLLAVLWGGITVLGSVFSGQLPLGLNGLALAVCWNLAPLILLAVFSLLLGETGISHKKRDRT